MPHAGARRVPRDERRAPCRRYAVSPGHGRVERRPQPRGDRLPPGGGRDLRAPRAHRSRRGAGLPRPRRGALRSTRSPAAAIACYERSLELARGIGDKSYESENLMMVGYASSGYHGARRLRARQGELRGRARDRTQGATCSGTWGRRCSASTTCARCAGRYDEARQRHAEYAALAREAEADPLSAHRLRPHRASAARSRAEPAGGRARRARPRARAREAGSPSGGRASRRTSPSRACGSASSTSARRWSARRDIAGATRKDHQLARCLEGLAELALARGDAAACLAFADELLALAEPAGLRELAAQARRWRGEALLAKRQRAAAEQELQRAAAVADEIGRVRLASDAREALARC